MTAKFPTFPSRSNELSSIEILFFPLFFYRSSTMKNVHGDLNTNRDKNTESVEWKYNASNAILPFFPDKLRLLFFASHLVPFRISLDNEKDILRRLMNGKDSRSRLNLSEYIARASRCSDFQLLSFSLSFFSLYSFQSSTRPRIQMGANRKHFG